MGSMAYANLSLRMKDIQQLMQTHTALTQFRRARRAVEETGGDLAQISSVVNSLVTFPRRGRRAEVDALNRAAIVLLSAHLQGYIEDLHAEAANHLFSSTVKDPNALITEAQSRLPNPLDYCIEQLFRSLGLPNILEELRWQKASNRRIRRRLSKYIEMRNRITHGSQETISKEKVQGFKHFVELFAERFDAKVRTEIKDLSGRAPWPEIPENAGVTVPRTVAIATAVSTAFPPFFRTSTPTVSVIETFPRK